jgi:hypothetical protein
MTGTNGVDEPDFIGPLEFFDPRCETCGDRHHSYFNRSAFRSQPLGGLGNANRRFFHGPGFNNWDIGIHKDTRIRESMLLQFRAEFFNVFNHAQFINPTGSYNNTLMGEVRSARDPRIGQLSLKFLW